MDILLFEIPTVSDHETNRLEPLLDGFASVMEWEVVRYPVNCLLTIKGIGIKAMDIIKQFKKQGIVVNQVFGE